ncbi:MAG: gliding motility-associated C-terminal domain-containing protein [Daejeonella sp.]
MNNIVTPNGDGFNDVWEIHNIDKYPSNQVKIFDRAGRLVFSQRGYNNNWGAEINEHLVEANTYYYIIYPGPGLTELKGFISVLKN